jgi:hypothetical protein
MLSGGQKKRTRVAGDEELCTGYQHYWEVKLTRPVYGTDVMIGIATKAGEEELERVHPLLALGLGTNRSKWKRQPIITKRVAYLSKLHGVFCELLYSPALRQGWSLLGALMNFLCNW